MAVQSEIVSWIIAECGDKPECQIKISKAEEGEFLDKDNTYLKNKQKIYEKFSGIYSEKDIADSIAYLLKITSISYSWDDNELDELKKEITGLKDEVKKNSGSLSKNTSKIESLSEKVKDFQTCLESQQKDKFPKFFDIVKDTDINNPIYSFLLTEENPIPVTSETIKSKRFANETNLKAVKLVSKEGIGKKTLLIESNAFENCAELKEIYFDKSVPTDERTISIVILKNEPPNTIVTISKKEDDSSFEIKSYEEKDSKKIKKLENTALASLTLQFNSFFHCTKLHTMLLPPCGNLIIEKSAFEGCPALRTVLILCSHAQINENAFAGCDNVVFVSNCDDVLSFARNRGLEFVDVNVR